MSKKKRLFSASDIRQFSYCSVSWFLKKQGYGKSSTKKITYGIRIHDRLGRKTRMVSFLKIAGKICIILGIFLMVILLAPFDVLLVGW